MGFCITTYAVRGKSAETIHADLRLRATGEMIDAPDAPVAGAALPSGWYLVWFDDRVPESSVLALLSSGAEVISLHVNEHTMSAVAERWANGRRAWSIYHDQQVSVDNLETEGELPACYESIRAKEAARNQEPDSADHLFEIPVEVVRELTGFRYDEDIDDLQEFEVLELIAPSKRWWRFWR